MATVYTQNTWNNLDELKTELIKVRNVWVQHVKEMKANKTRKTNQYYKECLERVKHLTNDIHALSMLPKVVEYLRMDGCNVEGTPDIKYYYWHGQRLLSVGTGLKFCVWGYGLIYSKMDYSRLWQIYAYLFTNFFKEMVEEKGWKPDGQPVELRNLTMEERLGRTKAVLGSEAVFEIEFSYKVNPNFKPQA
jgi:hypothetical protein